MNRNDHSRQQNCKSNIYIYDIQYMRLCDLEGTSTLRLRSRLPCHFKIIDL